MYHRSEIYRTKYILETKRLDESLFLVKESSSLSNGQNGITFISSVIITIIILYHFFTCLFCFSVLCFDNFFIALVLHFHIFLGNGMYVPGDKYIFCYYESVTYHATKYTTTITTTITSTTAAATNSTLMILAL